MILSLETLLERSMNELEFVAAMRAAISEFSRYRDAIPTIPQSYSRLLLRKTGAFELVAMQWSAGAVSPIHDHGESRCWVVMLDGVLDVENYDRVDDGLSSKATLVRTEDMRLKPGDLDHRLNWRELHRVKNATPQPVYSVQLYAAPQIDYAVVDETTMLCRRALPAYDSAFEL